LLEADSQLVEEAVLDRTNHICESWDVGGVVLDAIGEEQRNLLSLDALAARRFFLVLSMEVVRHFLKMN